MDLLRNIFNIIIERESDNFDCDADNIHFIVVYRNNRVEIYEVEDYFIRSSEDWGVIDVKSNKSLIATLDVSMSDYLSSVCMYANKVSHSYGDMIIEEDYGNVYHEVKFYNELF